MPGQDVRDGVALNILLSVTISLQLFGISVLLPALPAITATLGGTAETAQLTISAYLLGVAATQLVHGSLADRHGRRPILIVGLAFYTLAGIGCAMSPSLDLLIALRFVQGVGAAAGAVVSRAIVSDLYEGPAAIRKFAQLGAIVSLVPLLAPILGGWLLLATSWSGILALLAVIGAILMLGTVGTLRETLRPRLPGERPRLIADCRRFVANRESFALALVVAFVSSGLFAYSATSSFVIIQVFGISSAVYGALLAFTACFTMLGTVTAARVATRWPPRRSLDMALTLAVSSAAVIFAGSLSGWRDMAGLAVLVLPMAVYCFAMGLLYPVALASALKPVTDMSALASAIFGTAQMGVAAVFIWLGGRLYDGTPQAIGICTAAGGCVGCAIYFGIARPRLGN